MGEACRLRWASWPACGALGRCGRPKIATDCPESCKTGSKRSGKRSGGGDSTGTGEHNLYSPLNWAETDKAFSFFPSFPFICGPNPPETFLSPMNEKERQQEKNQTTLE